jgi:hypothetical protein
VAKKRKPRGGRYTPPAVSCLLCRRKVEASQHAVAIQVGTPGHYEPGIAHGHCAEAAATYVQAEGGTSLWEPLTPELLDDVFG